MTAITDIDTVHSIMSAFRMKRLRWLKDNKMDHENLPASLSRESEALVIIKAIREGKDWTQEMIGHHQ